MEITTCEQYVLASLEAKDREIDELEDRLVNAIAERDDMQRRVSELERKLDEEPGTLEACVVKAGRRKIFDDCTWTNITKVVDGSGEFVPFNVWCEDAVRDYGRPSGVSVSDFVEFFKPEFEDEYERAVSMCSADE